MNAIEWTEIDADAAREGAAVLRLSRRTGRRDPIPADLHNRASDAGRHIRYSAAAAREAFERLFGGASPRRELYATRGDRQRRRRQREQRATDRQFGESLRGLPPEEVRRAFLAARAGNGQMNAAHSD
jgi:hypothetical protein